MIFNCTFDFIFNSRIFKNIILNLILVLSIVFFLSLLILIYSQSVNLIEFKLSGNLCFFGGQKRKYMNIFINVPQTFEKTAYFLCVS